MGLGYKRTDTVGDIPVFQGTGKDIQLAQGGFLMNKGGLPVGTIIKAGTPVVFNETTREAKFLPTGKIVENAGSNATTYKVAKGHTFKIGDYFAKKVGEDAYSITSIDSSNADYDVITVETTIGSATAGDWVFASSEEGASKASFEVNGLLYRDHKIDDGESCSVVIRGTVYARRVPYSKDLEEALRHIIYSQSY